MGNNASGRGFLRANGDVMGMFFESARVWVRWKWSVRIYCLRSEIHAGTRIEISGRNGVLAGGLAQAQNLIQATNIGNEASLVTRLVLGNKDEKCADAGRSAGREKRFTELRLLLNAYQEFRKKFEPVIRNVHPTYLKLEDAIYTKKTELEELKKRKDAVEKEQKKRKICEGSRYREFVFRCQRGD